MNCPNCQSDVKISEQNFGCLFTCPSCQAAYFINFEGQPEFGTMGEEAPPVSGEYNVAPVTFSEPTPTLLEPNSDASLNQLFEPIQTIPLDQPEAVQTYSDFEVAAQDISAFGNSETQGASLNYDLNISGLDTIEILSEFKEAIDDSRFGWETGAMMKSIHNGEISFLKLNPVKAYILSKRLEFLDVEKKWKQNVLS